MKTRKEIITDMCYTWRHDYGLDRNEHDGPGGYITAGLTPDERERLWKQMAQLYDNCIAPSMSFHSGTPDAYMAQYFDSNNRPKVYVTSIHELAVENDVNGAPAPLYKIWK